MNKVRLKTIGRVTIFYLAAAWGLLEAITVFTEKYSWDHRVFEFVLVILIFGLSGTILNYWFRFKKGSTKNIRIETTLQIINLAICSFFITEVAFGPENQIDANAIADGYDNRSVAVLPFSHFSDNKDDEYFTSGVQEDILTQLSKVRDIKVVSRTSTQRYKNTKKTIPEIGRELNVKYIVEGSVRKDDNTVRIVAQLIDSDEDKHVWAETYDRELNNVFKVQSEVAKKIAQSLKATITPEEILLIDKNHTNNNKAYDLYLRGRQYYYRYTLTDMKEAYKLFSAAKKEDNLFSLAYAGLSDTSCQLYSMSQDKSYLDSALIYAQKSIALDSQLSEGYKALAFTYHTSGKYDKAKKHYLTSTLYNPNYSPAISNLGQIYTNTGQLDDALVWMEKAHSIDPLNGVIVSNLSKINMRLSNFEKALNYTIKAKILKNDYKLTYHVAGMIHVLEDRSKEALQEAEELKRIYPEETDGYRLEADILLLLGNWKRAKQKYLQFAFGEQEFALNPNTKSPKTSLAYLLFKANKIDSAQFLLNYNEQRNLEAIKMGDQGFWYCYDMAAIRTIQGKYDESWIWLNRAIESGFTEYQLLEVDPIFEAVHDAPEFKAILQNLQNKVSRMNKDYKLVVANMIIHTL